MLLHPSAGLALDGRLNSTSTVQSGQAGSQDYRQSSLRSEGAGNQLVSFGRSGLLRVEGRLLRETFNSRFDSIRTNLTRHTEQAGTAFDLVGHRVRLGVTGNLLNQTDVSGGKTRLESQQLGASSSYRHPLLQLTTSGLLTTSRRENTDRSVLRDQEWIGSAGAETRILRFGELGYRISMLEDRSLTFRSKNSQNTQNVTFDGSRRFAGGRALAALRTRSTFFAQEQERRTGIPGEAIRLPLSAGYVLDDTPELLDPLEDAVTSVPGLADGVRTSPTVINLGDSAPPVREFGGDYRNIQFDFGEPVDLSSATLYVDQRLLAPEFFRWRLFTSNDPDGRIWDEATPGVTVSYREWGTGSQGWIAVFSQPVSARFFKMVDVKLGPTVPDLFVTELEVNVREDAGTGGAGPDDPGSEGNANGGVIRSRSHTTNHRLGGSLGYSFTPELNARYDGTFQRRTLSRSSGVLEESSHGLSAGWNRSIWAVNGRYGLRRLDGREASRIETQSQDVAVRRGRSDALNLDLAWARTHDNGQALERTANSLTLGAVWPVAPALHLRQRVSGARLNDFVRDVTSRTLALSTEATGSPVPSVTMDLEWVERWASRDAGAGFTRYRETSATLGWRPVPQVFFESQVHYQDQKRGAWLTRNTASWTPLYRGTLNGTLYGTHYRDTRAEETQLSAGVQLRWRASPNLSFHGNVEALALKTAGQENKPLNTTLRGSYTF